MGIPFPSGMAQVAHLRPALLPWAWGINGFASVVAAILATVLAIHLGFNAVIWLAAGLYALAAFNFPRPPRCRRKAARSASPSLDEPGFASDTREPGATMGPPQGDPASRYL
jgi:hypothetical protein